MIHTALARWAAAFDQWSGHRSAFIAFTLIGAFCLYQLGAWFYDQFDGYKRPRWGCVAFVAIVALVVIFW